MSRRPRAEGVRRSSSAGLPARAAGASSASQAAASDASVGSRGAVSGPSRSRLGHESPRGRLRHALVSVRNLHQMLASPQVGPKHLCDVASELDDARRTLAEAFDISRGDEDPVLRFGLSLVNELADVLATVGSPVGAKKRLELETQMARLAAELDAAAELADALQRSEGGPRIAMTVMDLLAGARSFRFGVDPRPVLAVSFEGGVGERLVLIDPPAAVTLLATVGALLRPRLERGETACFCVGIASEAPGPLAHGPLAPGLRLSVRLDASGKAAFGKGELWVPAPVPPAPWAASLLATRLGGALEGDAQGFTLSLPNAP